MSFYIIIFEEPTSGLVPTLISNSPLIMHYANLHPLAAVCYLGNIALIWLHKLFGDFLVDVSDIPKEAPDLNILVEEGSLLDSSGKG